MRFTLFAPLAMAAAACLMMGATATGARAQGQATGASSPKEDPIAPERPGFTNGTDTVPVGRVQFEFGYAFNSAPNSREHRVGDGAQVRFPFTDRFEGRIGLPAYSWARDRAAGERMSGLNDASVSLKYRLADDAPNHPSVAVIGGATLRTGVASFREDAVQPLFALEANQIVGDNFSLTADVVYNGIRSSGLRYDEWAGGLCANYSLTPTIGAFLEGYRISDSVSGGTHANYVDGGFTYLIGANTQLDLSAGVGAEKSVRREYFIGAGVSRRW